MDVWQNVCAARQAPVPVMRYAAATLLELVVRSPSNMSTLANMQQEWEQLFAVRLLNCGDAATQVPSSSLLLFSAVRSRVAIRYTMVVKQFLLYYLLAVCCTNIRLVEPAGCPDLFQVDILEILVRAAKRGCLQVEHLSVIPSEVRTLCGVYGAPVS